MTLAEKLAAKRALPMIPSASGRQSFESADETDDGDHSEVIGTMRRARRGALARPVERRPLSRLNRLPPAPETIEGDERHGSAISDMARGQGRNFYSKR
jgi:hypothetical protein